MKKYLLERLDCFKDDEFVFDSTKHKYTYLGENFISVTTFYTKIS